MFGIKRKITSQVELYERVYAILSDRTPIKQDCGQLCEGICCKGTQDEGMLLFPGERSTLPVRQAEGGNRLVVCGGSCERAQRPLACRLFPFFPILRDDGSLRVEIDARALRLCPLAIYADRVRFERGFLRAVKRAGKLLASDAECAEFLRETSEEIGALRKFFVE